jgi:hypothetical protein
MLQTRQMHRQLLIRWLSRPTSFAALAICLATVGCGTTKWSDTPRTGTEQMLISDAVDRTVSAIDFSALAGRKVWLENKYITTNLDQNYITSTLRQHMLANGCIIKEKADEADYVVEVRAGAVGTNRHDLLFGMPQTNLPVGGMFPLAPTSIPEVPLMKRTGQQGICKIAVFAYERNSGHPVWQSGTRQFVSKAKDSWFFGAGPFQSGTIYEGTKFAGEKLSVPMPTPLPGTTTPTPPTKTVDVQVSREIIFAKSPTEIAAQPVATSPPIANTSPVANAAPPADASSPLLLPAGVVPASAIQLPGATSASPAQYFEPLAQPPRPTTPPAAQSPRP